MAIQRGNILLTGTSGSIGKLLTFKQYNGITVVCRYPDMSKVIYTAAQLAERLRFRLAVAYARTILSDPAKKAAYPLKGRPSVYHAAIADYMRNSKKKEKQSNTPVPQPKNENTIKSPRPAASRTVAIS